MNEANGEYIMDYIDYVDLVIMMISCGILGGLINYYLDKGSKSTTNTAWEYIVIGIGASLLVPLFLNMIGSNLIDQIPVSRENILIIMGFSLIAAMTSRSFIKNIGDRALQTANAAEKKANELAVTLTLSEKRANSIIMPVVMIELEKFKQAIIDLDKVLRSDPEFAEAWAWRGFAEKRLNNYEQAVISMEKAIKLEKSPSLLWHYNLACYKALAGRSINDIAKNLDVIYNSNEKTKDDIINALQNDSDFASIKGDEDFGRYLL